MRMVYFTCYRETAHRNCYLVNEIDLDAKSSPVRVIIIIFILHCRYIMYKGCGVLMVALMVT